MEFLRTFIGAFYSQALYTRLRNGTGYGFHYSLLLLGFIAVVCTTIVMLNMPAQMEEMMPKMRQAPVMTFMVITIGAVLLRSLMLLTLAVAARLITLKLKPVIDYPAAFRIAGVAYTPVAVIDAVVFCLKGETMGPLVLFAAGVIMLLAALYSSR